MRAVFDLDDTISVHKNRDYPNAKPIVPVIEKIRQMKDDGWEIVIYSARGQVSCKGDLKEIEHKNRPVVEEWLRRHNVPFDELVFGKPLGDIYVDDKGMSLTDFLSQPFCVLQGGSGKAVYRQGNIVRKEFGTYAETCEFKDWINTSRGEYQFPRIISYVYNTVYMEYVDGSRGCDIDAVFIPTLLNRIFQCKKTSPQAFDITKHIDRLLVNKTGDDTADKLLCDIADYLRLAKERLSNEGSYCHGDLTLSNMIVTRNGLCFVDPRNTTGANSYLLDLAKLRMSLNGYERIFGISDIDNSKWTKLLDSEAENAGVLMDVIALEIMFIFRCFRYKKKEEQEKVVQFALAEAEGW